MLRYVIIDTGWGPFGLVAEDDTVVATYLPGLAERLRKTLLAAWPQAKPASGLLGDLRARIQAYFAGERVNFKAKLDLSRLTPFQRTVLRACRRIPYGRTASYADLARAAGRPAAARAVGGVMARNPVPLLIPCHRVVRRDGALGGFSSPQGINQKRRMLALEGL
jgi:methylated-DNA-[protein]-cysteine S-methyltransferase